MGGKPLVTSPTPPDKQTAAAVAPPVLGCSEGLRPAGAVELWVQADQRQQLWVEEHWTGGEDPGQLWGEGGVAPH